MFLVLKFIHLFSGLFFLQTLFKLHVKVYKKQPSASLEGNQSNLLAYSGSTSLGKCTSHSQYAPLSVVLAFYKKDTTFLCA